MNLPKINMVTIIGGIGGFFINKVIGLDSIPPEKREEVKAKALDAAVKVVKAAAEGAAAGVVEGAKGKSNVQF